MKSALKNTISIIAKASGIDDTSSVDALVDGLPESMLAPLLSQQLTENRIEMVEDREMAFFDEFKIPGLTFGRESFEKLPRSARRSIWKTIDVLIKDVKREAARVPTKAASAASTASSLIGAAMTNGGGGGMDIGGMLGLMQTLGAGNPVVQKGMTYFRDNQHRLQDIQKNVIMHIRSVMRKFGINREAFFSFIVEIIAGIPLIREYSNLIDKEELLNAVFGSNAPETNEEREKARVLSSLTKFDL